jgi:protease PrsW
MNTGPKAARGIWLQVVVIGGALFFGAEQALKYTGNPNFFPTIILLGALIVPVALVSYFYNQERRLDPRLHPESPLMQVFMCFVVGGALGVILAGVIEYATLTTLGIGGLLAVALIEESAKLVLPAALFVNGKYRSEIDGILFGTASGMGFAALETMGYGLVALIRTQGSLGVLEEVLLIRGLLSPMGHSAWTGLVCASLWSWREKTGKRFHPMVLGAFGTAVALHTLWDLAGVSSSISVNFAGYVIIGGISLFLLIRRLGEAKKASVIPA